jgi:hypothetical protein
MGLFLVLFWSWAVMSDVLADNSRNSRLGGFNSRLVPHEFRFRMLRELTSKCLIYLAFFCPEAALFEHSWKIPGFHGKNREFCDYTRWRRRCEATRASSLSAPFRNVADGNSPYRAR